MSTIIPKNIYLLIANEDRKQNKAAATIYNNSKKCQAAPTTRQWYSFKSY